MANEKLTTKKIFEALIKYSRVEQNRLFKPFLSEENENFEYNHNRMIEAAYTFLKSEGKVQIPEEMSEAQLRQVGGTDLKNYVNDNPEALVKAIPNFGEITAEKEAIIKELPSRSKGKVKFAIELAKSVQENMYNSPSTLERTLRGMDKPFIESRDAEIIGHMHNLSNKIANHDLIVEDGKYVKDIFKLSERLKKELGEERALEYMQNIFANPQKYFDDVKKAVQIIDLVYEDEGDKLNVLVPVFYNTAKNPNLGKSLAHSILADTVIESDGKGLEHYASDDKWGLTNLIFKGHTANYKTLEKELTASVNNEYPGVKKINLVDGSIRK